MSRRTRAVVPPVRALLLVVLLVVAACGGGGGDEAVTTTTTSTTTSTSTTTTTIPSGRSPLTGLPVTEQVAARPVVAVKIDNVDGKATPQVGINAADVVYEIQVEGQITRLLSLFQSADAAPVGPVRSARGSEVGILEELNGPLFTWHGANDILRAVVRNSAIVPRSIDDIPGLFYRQSGRPNPYDSFVRGTAEIRETAPEGAAGPTEPIFVFGAAGESPSPGAAPVSQVTIRFPAPFGRGGGEAPATFKWDESTGLWRREQSGRLHVDGNGDQIAVANVIVRFTRALDSGTIDKSGTVVPTAEVVGTGEVWVLTQGTITTGTWVKDSNTARTRYLDQLGNEIKLAPGKTWISMPYGPGSSFS